MAAPHVAGAAALILAAQPDATWNEVKTRLVSSVDKVAGLATKVSSGGRLNVAKEIE